jgi:hypothetical protein
LCGDLFDGVSQDSAIRGGGDNLIGDAMNLGGGMWDWLFGLNERR